MPDFLPRSNTLFESWTRNFAGVLPAIAVRAKFSSEWVERYQQLQERFARLLGETNSSAQRSGSSVFERQAARVELERMTRQSARQIRGYIADDPAALVMLGLRPTQPRRRLARPTLAPLVHLAPTLRRSLRVTLKDEQHPTSRAKPEGIHFATLWISSPRLISDPSSPWIYCGSSSRTSFELPLPHEIQNGDPVTIRACWTRAGTGQGPMSQPATTRVLFNPDTPVFDSSSTRGRLNFRIRTQQAA